ncbi:survival of motor neuron-related-splicing factor 30-like [Varroa jacobsoni]|uniref:Survival of motor neuron-related-splicing factor 30 n=1 Tax=Varroa destructor TaxID=109461 RepID=A0A7M7K756_VARDE|nr:survival of motor neuron-related-splicing factor 30-like [Varroa destructor]XP_022692589.1 survival of motor neuron-related-splicing factor 30-like [Varroa jacobsoni]
MADKEDLQTQLETYHVQLQQVEAALASNPDDPDLRKLREDLCEVISLTKSLSASSRNSDLRSVTHAEDSGGVCGSGIVGSAGSTGRWQVGDRVSAPWAEDGNYYDATVVAISSSDGLVTVDFEEYPNNETVHMSELKPRNSGGHATKGGKKAHVAAQKEYKKQKAMKKKERLKEIEQQREADKKIWQNFSAKAQHKKKGVTKKSIFATPESVAGRVGIGTCGVADRPMTEYHQIEKHQVVKKTSLQHPCNLPGPAGLN